MIKVTSLCKTFGAKIAVNNVSFQVKPGEVLGFLGPNGAGKSTTMRMLTGYLPPTSGLVEINGFNMEEAPIQAKRHIGYLPENAPAYQDSTVLDFLNFMAEAKGLSGEARQQAVQKAMDICQLNQVKNQTIDTLSKGYKHRTCFAQAILNNPPVLVLDEPTDGLDPNQKQDMRHLIREMGKTKAIIVSTHILEEVEAICTRVIIIDKGEVVFNGTPAELRQKSPETGIVCLHIKNLPFDEFSKVMLSLSSQVKTTREENGLYCVIPKTTDLNLAPEIKKLADYKKWDYDQLFTKQGRLEEVFHAITSKETKTQEGNK